MLIGAAKLNDFQPLSQEEFQHLASQIQLHLSKGVPVSAPVQGLPMEALCRVLRTILVLGQQSEQALAMFKEVFAVLGDDQISIKLKLAPLVLQGEDLTDFLSQHPIPEPEEKSDDLA